MTEKANRFAFGPDEELVRRAKTFDEAALSFIFDTYYPRIYNYGLIQLRDTRGAEDLASDVMLRVLESISGYHPRGVPLSAWVFRTARNRLIDVRRRHVRRREVGLVDDAIAPAGPPHATVERALDHGTIRAALSQLTDVQGQVVVLRFMKDLDVATVARIVGRSQSAVKSLQFRALASLRRHIESNNQRAPIPSGSSGSVVAVP